MSKQMQVKVWPGELTCVRCLLPAPLAYEECHLATALIHIGNSAVLVIRVNTELAEIAEILQWSEEQGAIQRLQFAASDALPQTPVRRILWLNHFERASEINGDANFVVLPSSYSGPLPIIGHFKTTQGEEWCVHSLIEPEICKLVFPHERFLLTHVSDSCQLTTAAAPRLLSARIVSRDLCKPYDAQMSMTNFKHGTDGDFEMCASGTSVYFVSIPSMAIHDCCRNEQVFAGLKPFPPVPEAVRMFMGIGTQALDVFVSGYSMLFKYDHCLGEWQDIRVRGGNWIRAEQMWTTPSGHLCMIDVTSPKAGPRFLEFTRVNQGDTAPPKVLYPFQYSDEEIELMHDAIFRVGTQDFKVVAAAFCAASSSDVLKSMLFGSFAENIHDAKRARVVRVVDLTELLGNSAPQFALVYAHAMKGEGWGLTLSVAEIEGLYQVCNALCMMNVYASIDRYVEHFYLSKGRVLEVVRGMDIIYASRYIKDRCVEAMLNLCVEKPGGVMWPTVRNANVAWARECIEYTRTVT